MSVDQADQRRSRRFIIGFVVVALVAAIAAVVINLVNPFNLTVREPVAQVDGVYSALAIDTAKGRFTFKVETADDEPERSRGLMFRKTMPADQGMLFVYPDDRDIAMWMKNTYISLDMVFINANGKVHSVAERTETLSERTIPSNGPVRAVLELNAGKASEIGLKAGDMVRHPAFANVN
jgi:uncharacterized protein